MNKMTGGQLTQIYNIATQQGCGQEKVQFLIQSGLMADFFAGKWSKRRVQFRKLGGLPHNCQTLKLGTGLKNAEDFRRALQTIDCEIGDWANNILDRPAFSASSQAKEVDLVLVSVSELGFDLGASREDIYKRAAELGLDLCPNEVGPQICIQMKGRLPLGRVQIGMEPMNDSVGHLSIFVVKREDNGKIVLQADSGRDGTEWTGHSRWVFVARK